MLPTDPRTNMVHLDPVECRRLLRAHTHEIGRLAFVERGAPVIVPVNYAVIGDVIVVRTAPGAKLEAAYRRARVSFEIDQFDADRRTGWSVVVRGRAESLTRRVSTMLTMATALQPWVDGKPYWIEIVPEEISGRMVPSGVF